MPLQNSALLFMWAALSISRRIKKKLIEHFILSYCICNFYFLGDVSIYYLGPYHLFFQISTILKEPSFVVVFFPLHRTSGWSADGPWAGLKYCVCSIKYQCWHKITEYCNVFHSPENNPICLLEPLTKHFGIFGEFSVMKINLFQFIGINLN